MANDKKDELKEIKELLEIVNNRVGHLNFLQSASSSKIRLMKDQQSVINEKLDNQGKQLKNITEKLDDPEDGLVAIKDKVGMLVADVEHIRTTTKATHELLKGTRDRQQGEIDEIKKHVGLVTG